MRRHARHRGIDAGARPTPYERAEQLAADLHGAARTWFLTNGATQGNHALVLAATGQGRLVAVERNAHASVLDGLVMSGGAPVDLVPSRARARRAPGVVSPRRLAAALHARPEVSVVFMTSPPYFGMVSDIAGCAAVAHEHGAR
jgi:arginine decarboxylase